MIKSICGSHSRHHTKLEITVGYDGFERIANQENGIAVELGHSLGETDVYFWGVFGFFHNPLVVERFKEREVMVLLQ